MRSIRLHLTIAGRPAAATYSTLVSAVAVSPRELHFRQGVLRWAEENTLDPVRHQIHFRQLDGDVARFDGSWSCVDDGDDTAVTFAARLNLTDAPGDDPLEPMAVHALVDQTGALLSQAFDGRLRVDDIVIQTQQQVSAA